MELAELLEVEEIKRLKYAYMRCVDTKRWDELAGLFVPEATAAYSAGHYCYEGRDEIVAWLKKGMERDSLMTSHSVHQPEITLEAPDRASGIWKLEDIVVDTQFDVTISGAAFYHDRYVKRDGRWLIEHTGYERIFEQIQSRKELPGWKLTASMWTTGGASEIEA